MARGMLPRMERLLLAEAGLDGSRQQIKQTLNGGANGQLPLRRLEIWGLPLWQLLS